MSKRVFDDLMEGVREVIAIGRGEAAPSTYRVHIPAEIDTRRIRAALRLTQPQFSKRFGIPLGTLRDWEQGLKVPDAAARALIKTIDHEPKAVERALRKAAAAA